MTNEPTTITNLNHNNMANTKNNAGKTTGQNPATRDEKSQRTTNPGTTNTGNTGTRNEDPLSPTAGQQRSTTTNPTPSTRSSDTTNQQNDRSNDPASRTQTRPSDLGSSNDRRPGSTNDRDSSTLTGNTTARQRGLNTTDDKLDESTDQEDTRDR
jgi:hypothetical protein